MPSTGIEIEGVREFHRALAKFDPELNRTLKVEMRTVADTVADTARAAVPSKSGRTRASVRAGADNKGPWVAGGKRAVPHYGWLDFGSRRPVTGQPRSYGPWFRSGAGPARGRFIYPAIDRNRDTIRDAAIAALNNARDAAGLGGS
jgi:hypothetical protein